MIITKTTFGWVSQQYDTKTRKFVHQEFIAGDQVEYEDENNEKVEPIEPYLPFEMVQPK